MNIIEKEFKNKYVIVRSRNEGVNAGILLHADSSGVILDKARRLFYMIPFDKKLSWYEGVAESGLASGSRVSSPVKKCIIESYSITEVTEQARKSIEEFPTNEQS